MKAQLFEGFQVEIDVESLNLGGAWFRNKRGQARVSEQGMLAFFDAQITRYKATRILDVGASTGSYCLLAARHPDLHVLAFEPNPEVFAVLQRNIALNGLEDRVKPIPLALFNKAGVLKLKIPTKRTNSGFACLGQPRRFKRWRAIDVKVKKLDGLITDVLRTNGFVTVDLLKVDVEGAELQVLQGAERLIKQFRPGILLEYCERNTQQFGYNPQAISGLLKSWGYRRFRRFKVDLWASM